MHLELPVPRIRFIIKFILWLLHFFNENKIILVCKGYDNDWKYYTGLYWKDDKDNYFIDYEDFTIWVGLNFIEN